MRTSCCKPSLSAAFTLGFRARRALSGLAAISGMPRQPNNDSRPTPDAGPPATSTCSASCLSSPGVAAVVRTLANCSAIAAHAFLECWLGPSRRRWQGLATLDTLLLCSWVALSSYHRSNRTESFIVTMQLVYKCPSTMSRRKHPIADVHLAIGDLRVHSDSRQ